MTFGSERNGVKLNSYWLGIEFVRSNAHASDVFAEKADALNEKRLQSSDLCSLIEAHLLPDLHRCVGDAETVAEKMGVSRSALYRRPKEEGKTFAAINDDLRKRLAIDYSCSHKVSTTETAYLTGFAEASSFVRAFK